MTQLRVVPKGTDTSAMNFFADSVVLESSGWKCHRGDKFAGYIWAGYAQVYSAEPSAREVSLVKVQA